MLSDQKINETSIVFSDCLDQERDQRAGAQTYPGDLGQPCRAASCQERGGQSVRGPTGADLEQADLLRAHGAPLQQPVARASHQIRRTEAELPGHQTGPVMEHM